MTRLTTVLAACVITIFSHASTASDRAIRICDDDGCRITTTNQVIEERKQEAVKIERATTDTDTYQGEKIDDLYDRAQSGDFIAAYKIGIAYHYGMISGKRNTLEAIKYYDQAIQNGHIWSMFRKAEILSSLSGSKDNYRKSFELYFSAAKAGHPQSANNIGIAFLKGNSIPINKGEALRWLLVAAEGGIVDAQMNVGKLYLSGEAGETNLWEGFQWTRKAAMAGNHVAAKSLGRIYMTGLQSIRQDLYEADKWLSITANSGDKESQKWLQQVRIAQDREREYAERMQAQAAETFKFLAGVALQAAFSPPPMYVVQCTGLFGC